MGELLLPGQPGFNEILATPPPDPGREFNYIVRPGSSGVAEIASEAELTEYLNSGEYDERLAEIEIESNSLTEVSINSNLRSDVLHLPCCVSF
jgi:hypothetical protein